MSIAAALVAICSGVIRRPAGRRKQQSAARAHGQGLRVALVSEFFYPTLGGIQEHMFFFARHLIQRGHKPTIITPRVFGSGEFHNWWPTSLPANVYRPVGHSVPLFINGSLGRTAVGWRLGSQLRNLLTDAHFDVVHLHSPLAGTLPILALPSSSVPVVGTVHTSFASSTTLKVGRNLAQQQFDALAAVIAVSPIALASVRSYLHVDATIVPNGVDTRLFRPWQEGEDDRLPEFRDGHVNIFAIGRPDPRNGLDAVVRAFARVHRAVPKTRLLIAGEGELMQRYREMVAALLLAPGAVVFLGAVRDQRPRLYRTADIQVFIVERAAFSVTLLEGMATGLPIITTNWNGHEHMGNAGEHFVTIPFDDDAALERELLTYVNDPEKRQQLGARARAHALSYDWQVIGDRIIDVYERVVGR